MVYDMGNGRVYKELHPSLYSFREVYKFCRSRNKMSVLASIKSGYRAVKKERKVLNTAKEMFKTVPKECFANPVFEDTNLNYSQDKVTILEDYFLNHTLEDNKKIIDGYCELQKVLWSYGVHDRVYKFQINYGVTGDNKVVFIDFGESFFTKEEAKVSITTKKWLSRESYKNWGDKELKEYYKNKMDELMTEENIHKYWNHHTVNI